MSSTNTREQKLLLFLLKNQDFVTAEDISTELQVSIKTIYRLVKKINSNNSNVKLIMSEKGRGYKLNYENYITFQREEIQVDENNVSPRERQKRIMEKLLISAPKPIKVHELFDPYFVGDSVIFSDEQIMSGFLKQNKLELIRKNRSLSIIGEEQNIRRALKEVSDVFNIIDIEDLKNNRELNFNKYDVLFIVEQIRFIEKELQITLPYPYNVNIFSHLYILLNRIKNKSNYLIENNISNDEIISMEKEYLLYKVAKNVVSNVQEYLQHELPQIEVYYLFQYLVSSRMQETYIKEPNFSDETIIITNDYITKMSEYLNLGIDSKIIFVDLANHIKPMLNRLKHNIRIKNSLLNQIEINYENIFRGVEQTSQFISNKYRLPRINKDENGFITLYFAKIVEINQHLSPINTLIMCTTGIGTSELLRVKIEKKFPELKIVDVVSTRNLISIEENISEIDLIISTVNVNDDFPVEHLLVSAMFTLEDQKRLEMKIEDIYHGK